MEIQTISSIRYPELFRLLRNLEKNSEDRNIKYLLRSGHFAMPSDEDEKLIFIIPETSSLGLVPGPSLPSEEVDDLIKSYTLNLNRISLVGEKTRTSSICINIR